MKGGGKGFQRKKESNELFQCGEAGETPLNLKQSLNNPCQLFICLYEGLWSAINL